MSYMPMAMILPHPLRKSADPFMKSSKMDKLFIGPPATGMKI